MSPKKGSVVILHGQSKGQRLSIAHALLQPRGD